MYLSLKKCQFKREMSTEPSGHLIFQDALTIKENLYNLIIAWSEGEIFNEMKKKNYHQNRNFHCNFEFWFCDLKNKNLK